LEVIEQFGFDRQVFIQESPTTGELGCIPVMLRHLHQLIHLNHASDYLVIQDVPEVTERNDSTDTTGAQDIHSER
jgi:hypothetical protein